MDPAADHTTPSERTWTINVIVPDGQGGVTEDLAGARDAMFEVQAVMLRIGGVCSMAAKREQLEPDGPLITTAIVIRWQSFVPAVKAPAGEAPAEATQPEG